MKKIILILALSFAVNQIKAMTSIDSDAANQIEAMMFAVHPTEIYNQYLDKKYGENGWYGEIDNKDLPIRNSSRLNSLIEMFIREAKKMEANGIDSGYFHDAISEFTTLILHFPKLQQNEETIDQLIEPLKKSQNKMSIVTFQNLRPNETEKRVLYERTFVDFAFAQVALGKIIEDMQKYDPNK